MSRRPVQQGLDLEKPAPRAPAPGMAAVMEVYAEHEPLRRHWEAHHWLNQTGGDSSRVHALLARISDRRGQAAADQLAADMKVVQRARRLLRDGVTTHDRVDDLRAKVTREAGADAAEALIQAMRLEWSVRHRWW